MVKVLVTGDRNGYPAQSIWAALKAFDATKVIVGDATGVDTQTLAIASSLGIPTSVWRANWPKYGKRAGPIRNGEMLDQKPSIVLAFHRDIEHSKGTANCIKQAKKRGIQVVLFE